MDKLKWILIPSASFALVTILVLLMRAGIKPESNKWYGILYASDYFPPLNSFPESGDADERNLICKKLGEAYPFKMSSLHPDHKSFYGLPGSRYSLITIYEVVDASEQQKIIDIARIIKRSCNTRSFVIEFYDRETGLSPHDQFLRKVRID